jgi:4-alpha-glucanotransferase
MKPLPRCSGLIAHVSSLAGAHGIGDFGPSAFQFVDFLAAAGQSLWQILPLGPTGYGNSPYQGLSAFAGNPLFVSIDVLAEQGWLDREFLSDAPEFPVADADYETVAPWHGRCLASAFDRFGDRASAEDNAEWRAFHDQNRWWLDDYALYIAIKESQGDRQWTLWPTTLARREADDLDLARSRFARRIELESFIQFQCDKQWRAVKNYAHDRGVRIVGDIPIFVAHDSADVWANQDMFFLNDDGSPLVVAGVPPDYFSETGQLWGNPLYRWSLLAERGYEWWVKRFRHAFSMFDMVRLDHFRGFEAYWEVPGDATTASSGRWMPGPGIDFFRAVKTKLGELPLIAEDLGVITPAVEALRDELGAPGMRVLQFAFGNDAKAADYRPHNYPRHCVVYTGTHDNDTAVGWFESKAGEGTTRTAEEISRERAAALAYLGSNGDDIAWDMIRLAWSSVAEFAIAPLQDVVKMGSEARMNLPGTTGGNWRWRVDPAQLTPQVARRLRELTEIYERRMGETRAAGIGMD